MFWDQWSECHHCLDKFRLRKRNFSANHFNNIRNESRSGGDILLPECPDEWKKWLVSICVDFTMLEGFALSENLFEEYYKPTLYQSAVKLSQGECHEYIFPRVPAFEWWVSWPLLRGGNGLYFRQICGAEGWEENYQHTLIRLYLLPKYSNSRLCYVYSKGQLRLDVGGRTKEQAIENWYKVVRPLRRILKQVRADLSTEKIDKKWAAY